MTGTPTGSCFSEKRNYIDLLWEKEGIAYALGLCEAAAERVPCFDLRFAKSETIVSFIRTIK